MAVVYCRNIYPFVNAETELVYFYKQKPKILILISDLTLFTDYTYFIAYACFRRKNPLQTNSI